jgi:hypothetical protein
VNAALYAPKRKAEAEFDAADQRLFITLQAAGASIEPLRLAILFAAAGPDTT